MGPGDPAPADAVGPAEDTSSAGSWCGGHVLTDQTARTTFHRYLSKAAIAGKSDRRRDW